MNEAPDHSEHAPLDPAQTGREFAAWLTARCTAPGVLPDEEACVTELLRLVGDAGETLSQARWHEVTNAALAALRPASATQQATTQVANLLRRVVGQAAVRLPFSDWHEDQLTRLRMRTADAMRNAEFQLVYRRRMRQRLGRRQLPPALTALFDGIDRQQVTSANFPTALLGALTDQEAEHFSLVYTTAKRKALLRLFQEELVTNIQYGFHPEREEDIDRLVWLVELFQHDPVRALHQQVFGMRPTFPAEELRAAIAAVERMRDVSRSTDIPCAPDLTATLAALQEQLAAAENQQP